MREAICIPEFVLCYSSPNSPAVKVGGAGTPFFSPDGSSLYVLGQNGMVSMRVPPSTTGTFGAGTPIPLFRYIAPRVAGGRSAELSRDGTRFLTIGTDQPDVLATQVLNDWTSLLGKAELAK